MLYTLHLFLAHPVLLVLRLIVPSVEQLCIVISQKKKKDWQGWQSESASGVGFDWI